ncbi:beta-glucosidase [Branchiibius hedensis]|uniref:Exo-alpha-(1->6)-L-arabinopyranosidase n=1 Tax=Branchiibius hedensis TaxID=672460 RepID=A0A2Y8ZQL3_9MICO|nr:glycoside hydrolase family 3 C-terminal domain-containing protein [Branchiibius hedensis]PWJ24781.1 beta-glucosidase [Branchiibius hedensis]SSA33598.1 beta-glucosidase [Branchiibius hedensis]
MPFQPQDLLPAEEITGRLSRTDKIRLLSGKDFWNTESVDGATGFMLTDGPHGLRKQIGSADHVGLADSVPATCFPPAAGLGATWNVDLLHDIGVALGREAAAQDVGVLLGPGLNIKRHPAGGRNFEYFSEDPFLSGKAAAAMVRGIQSVGVGACLKHFAANNQESNRMRVDSIVDERTLHEIYLTGFEIAVKESAPWTVMHSYNKLNGEHTGESYRLLTEILRHTWGFDGVVMSDWLATANRPHGVQAGSDLEMPGSNGLWDSRVAQALDAGTLSEADLDAAVTRLVTLAQKVAARPTAAPVDFEAHHALARRAAAEASVLLTNDGLLPLAADARVALIGAFAQTPRYQGAGSSLVHPTRLDNALDALRAQYGDRLTYVPGYDAATGDATAEDIAAARRAAREAEVVVLLIGLPASYESEGFDRTDLRLPPSHDALVEAVVDENPRTAVVLMGGAPVEMPWSDRPAAILEAYLGGQAGGSALADVLTGVVEPDGRLAESFPVSMLELPANADFASHPTQVAYREGLNVGYRFHDTWQVAPRFCFGHGLSYTRFEVSPLSVAGDEHATDRQVSVQVTNVGDRAGACVLQLYVHAGATGPATPEQELKGYAKVQLAAGETREVSLSLDARSFATYDATDEAWVVASGTYEIRIGLSSRDIRSSASVDIHGADIVHPATVTRQPVADDQEFAAMLGRAVPVPKALLPFDEDSTVSDLQQTWLGQKVHGALVGQVTKRMAPDDDANSGMMAAMIKELPLRGIAAASGGKLSLAALDRLIGVLNTIRRR